MESESPLIGDPRLPERFWEKVSLCSDPNGCWLWSAHVNAAGYGTFWFDKTTRFAHRVAYMELIGSIPDGLELDHLCRTRNCVNPSHLEPVTTRENCLRGISPLAKNAAKTHCVNGHPLSGENLKPDQLKRGYRRCLECHRARNRKYMAGYRISIDKEKTKKYMREYYFKRKSAARS